MDRRNLKAYAKYDGSGRLIPSSLIWRKKKPAASGGNWVELTGYECCNPTTSSTTTT